MVFGITVLPWLFPEMPWKKKTFHSIHLAFLSVCACPQKRELRRRSKCIPEHALRTSGIHFGYPRAVAEPDLVTPSPVGKVTLIGTKAIGEESLSAPAAERGRSPRLAAPAPWRLVLPACANQVRLANSNAYIFQFCFSLSSSRPDDIIALICFASSLSFPFLFFGFVLFCFVFFPFSSNFLLFISFFFFFSWFYFGKQPTKQTKPPPPQTPPTTTFGFAQTRHLNFGIPFFAEYPYNDFSFDAVLSLSCGARIQPQSRHW